MAMSEEYCLQSQTGANDPAPYSPTDDEQELAIERGHQNEHRVR